MKNNLKKRIAILSATLMVGAVGVYGTMAYFTDTDSETNVFTVGDIDIGLNETDWDEPADPNHPTDDENGGNMYPGYTVYKNPTIKNISTKKNGTEPCYARINIEVIDNDESLAQGRDVLVTDQKALDLILQTIRFDSTYNGNYSKAGTATQLTEGNIPGYDLTTINKCPTVNPQWTKDEVRSTANKWVYNYMGANMDGVLNIGEESTLFTNIVIPTDWNQTQMHTIGDFRLKITTEVIQAKGFANQASAYNALDAEIKGGTLQTINR